MLEGSSLFRGALRHPLRYGFALWGQWPRLAEGLNSWLTLRRAGVPLRAGWGIVAAHGHNEVTEVTIAQLNEQWRPLSGTSQTLSCDILCLGYGFVPATELARLLGVRHEWRAEQGGFVPVRDERMQTNVSGVYVVGDGAGIGGAALVARELGQTQAQIGQFRMRRPVFPVPLSALHTTTDATTQPVEEFSR